MATLDPGNIVNGNIIETNDLLQLYQAFGTGSGTSITGLKMTGSLNGNATTATTATTASNIVTTLTGSDYWYPTFVTSDGIKPLKIDNDLIYSASNNILTVTSSHAISASYAPPNNNYSYQLLPSSPITLSLSTPQIVSINTSLGFPYSFVVNAGINGQMVEFITDNATSNIAFSQIEITGSSAAFKGLSTLSVPTGNSSLLSNIVTTPTSSFSFKCLYSSTSTAWQIIL
jgi:hypothetical protein